MGIAVHRSFLTYVATVVEVEVDDQGEVKIPAVYTAVDAGLVVNPEATRSSSRVRRSSEPASLRSGEITAKDGVIEQSNFDNYPVARINELPTRRTSTLWTATPRRREWVSRACRRLRPRSATQFLPRPENGFANCRFRKAHNGPVPTTNHVGPDVLVRAGERSSPVLAPAEKTPRFARLG